MFTAESQFWCLSYSSGPGVPACLSLGNSPLLFGKAKFTLVIKEVDTAGTEAHRPGCHCSTWVPVSVEKKKQHQKTQPNNTPSRLLAFLLSALLWADCIFGRIIFVSPLALSFSACLLMTQRGFTKVFVSGITDVTQNSREMTYFGSVLDLASQRNIYCYSFTL